jgi:fatty acid synthase, animal type
MEEAATITAVYATVYYSLLQKGGLWNGASVLIHSGAGGVGLAALHVCLHRRCRVRSQLQLGQILDSD